MERPRSQRSLSQRIGARQIGLSSKIRHNVAVFPLSECSINSMRNPIPSHLKKVRRDITSYLFHFVNREGTPAEILKSILNDRFIRGGIYPPSATSTVCFTEAPLREVIRQDGILDSHRYRRLSTWESVSERNSFSNVAACRSYTSPEGGSPI
jgi:hypothetical protein